jgi:GPH family glycoside/pentoside/hexuronide:cation symporter
MAYFVLFVLGGDLGLLSAMVVTMTALALASQPLWVRLAARIGELRTFQVATVGIGLAFLGYVLLQPGQFTAGFGLMAMQGVFAGGGALMSWSLFVGAVQRYTVERGEHRPELLSGVWSAVEKSAFAIGVFIFGLVLQWLGLVPSRSLDTLQPDSALTGIRLGMAVLPALGMLLTLVMIRRGLAPHDVDTRGSA